MTDHDMQKALRVQVSEPAPVRESEIQMVAELRAELDRLRAQLPEGMQRCTIVFRECELGHGWLTATNWVQHGCPTCELNRLRQRVQALEAALRPFAVSIPDNWPGECVLTWHGRSEETDGQRRGAYISYLSERDQGGPIIDDYRRAAKALEQSQLARQGNPTRAN